MQLMKKGGTKLVSGNLKDMGMMTDHHIGSGLYRHVRRSLL